MVSKAQVELIITGKDEVTATLGKMKRELSGFSSVAKNAGLAMAGMGAAMTAAFGVALKASLEEEKGIVRLTQAMKNAGVQYQQSQQSLEKWIDAQSQKTAISDGQQRESLAQLVTSTHDLTRAQDLLMLAMDMSAGTGDSLASATDKVSMALAGNWGQLERSLPFLKQAQTEESKWALLRQAFAGQAEEYGKSTSGQLVALKNNIDNLKESIGGFVGQAINPVVGGLNKFMQGLNDSGDITKQWASNMGLGVAGTLTVTGGIALMLSQLPKAITLLKSMATVMGLAKMSSLGFGGALTGLLAGVGMIGLGVSGLISNDQAKKAYQQRIADTQSQAATMNAAAPGLFSAMTAAYETHDAQKIYNAAKAIEKAGFTLGDVLPEEITSFVKAIDNGAVAIDAAGNKFSLSLGNVAAIIDKTNISAQRLFSELGGMFSGLGMSFGFMRDAQGNITGAAETGGLTSKDLEAMAPTMFYDKQLKGMFDAARQGNPNLSLEDYFNSLNTGMSLAEYASYRLLDEPGGTTGRGASLFSNLNSGIRLELTLDGQAFGTAVASAMGNATLSRQRMGG